MRQMHKQSAFPNNQLRVIAISTVQLIPHKLLSKHLQRLGLFPSLIGQLMLSQDKHEY